MQQRHVPATVFLRRIQENIIVYCEARHLQALALAAAAVLKVCT
jgi:hypothetical protein